MREQLNHSRRGARHRRRSGHTGWARRRFESTALTLWVDGVRERVESARDELLKRPWALEGTSVAAMDVARATNRVTRQVTWVKRRRGSTPSAAGLIFYLAATWTDLHCQSTSANMRTMFLSLCSGQTRAPSRKFVHPHYCKIDLELKEPEHGSSQTPGDASRSPAPPRWIVAQALLCVYIGDRGQLGAPLRCAPTPNCSARVRTCTVRSRRGVR